MAVSGIFEGASPGAVLSSSRWGVLRLVRAWPATQAAAGDRADRWPDDLFAPAPRPRHLTVVRDAGTGFDRGAAAIALRGIITEWRAADRLLKLIPAGSVEWSRAQAEVVVLRESHHRLFAAIRRDISRA